MKILKLRALNINSLKGETQIDFEAAFGSEALFAITGPTGAGKSTLLDIITCALYGRTPRLTNPSELMSKNSGEAMCEVEFEVKGRRYRASWGQKRARLRIDGKLQPAKMTLQDLESEKILETGVRDVPKAVAELCGLDFTRFTQSMMLAQGSFDAFLRAKETERSELLEKITGTKIYTQLSIAAHEKHAALEKEVQIAREKLGVITLLDAETLAEKEARYKAIVDQNKNLKKAQKLLLEQIVWLERRSALEKELAQANVAFEAAKEERNANQELFAKFEVAQKAQMLAPLYQKWMHLAKQTEEESEQLTKLKAQQQNLLEEYREAQKAYETIHSDYVREKERFGEAQEKIKRARALQTREEGYRRHIETIRERLQILQKEREALQKALEQTQTETTTLEREIAEEEANLRNMREDAGLQEVLAVLKEEITRYDEALQKEEKLRYRQAEMVRTVQEQQVTLERVRSERKEVAGQLEEVVGALQAVEREFLEKAQQRPKIVETLQHYDRLLERHKRFTALQEKAKEIEAEITDAQADLKNLRREAAHIAELLTLHQTQRTLLGEKREQALLIQKYEADRRKLRKGEPCFLCGSTEHPYAAHLTTEANVDETEAELKKLEAEIAQLQKREKEKTEAIVRTETALQNLLGTLEEVKTELQHLERAFHEAQLNAETITTEDLEAQKKAWSQSLEEIETVAVRREALRKEKETLQQALQTCEQEYNKLDKADEVMRSETAHLDAERETVAQQLQTLEAGLRKRLETYGYTFNPKTLEKDYARLQERHTRYRSRLEDLQNCKERLQTIQLELTRQKEASANLTAEIEKREAEITEYRTLAEETKQERIAVLNVFDLRLHEVEVQTRFDTVQKRWQEKSAQLTALETEIKSLQEQIAALHETLEAHRKTLHEAQKTFETKRIEAGFADAAAFEAALMEDKAFETLQRQCETLRKRYDEAKTRKEEKEKTFHEHLRYDSAPTETVEILQKRAEALEAELETLQIEMGQIKQLLDQEKENREKHRAGIAALEEMEKELAVTGKLKALIGSADGSKFSRFAQGITLDQLIVLANRHLALLTKRYYLQRAAHEKQQLEIEIVDTFQGNITRSVHTLSGGESFIVSLALALGLSELASQKIKIDSLFLDEGFGTLDEESLETALNALSILQSSGKMIGVISHVEALKERIPAQINIIPKGDGICEVNIVGS